MLKRLIRSVRRQPKEARDKVALMIAAAFTFVVASVWMYHLPAKQAALTQVQTDTEGPGFSQLFDKVGSQLGALRDSVTEATESEEEMSPSGVPEEEAAIIMPTVPTGAVSATTGVSQTAEIATTAPSTAGATAVGTGSSTSPTVPTERVVRIVTTKTASSAASSTHAGN